MPRTRNHFDAYLELMEEEAERHEITAELCDRWGCTPDEVSDEDIAREKRKRDRAFARQIRYLEKEPD